jgi:hypothetical protein
MFLPKATSAMDLILTACVLASGVFLPTAPATAPAQPASKQQGPPKSPAKEMRKWPGEWLMEGNADQPCAIFQHGRVLLLVNENGDLATGRITEATKLVVLKGSWQEGLVGELTDEGKTISWGNGTRWKRP